MKWGRTAGALMALAIVAISSVAVYEVYYTHPVGCGPTGSVVRSQVEEIAFGAVTEFRLPGSDAWPNAITVSPDGSVWFAVQELPGLAHLFPENRSLVEYQWPGYAAPQPPDCIPSASSSGIALWNGKVWATDEFRNAIWGVNPSDGSTQLVNVTGKAELPYWLAVGPDGALWFTSDTSPAKLGRILPNMSLEVVRLTGMGQDQPLQLEFVNSSLAFLSAINLSTNSTTHACTCNGHVYSFDPGTVSAAVAPSKVGGDFPLQLPTSVSYSEGSVWVAQHGATSLARYDFGTGAWTAYPTSLVSWSETTLPLLVKAEGARAWFNEHYANKIGLVDAANGTLTEFSESLTPVTDYTGIQNDLSIALGGGRLWFTSMSGNYIGFVDSDFRPSFSLHFLGGNRLTLAPGENANLTLQVGGMLPSPLRVNVSDSENAQSVPRAIRIQIVGPSSQQGSIYVTVTAGMTIRPGDYTVAVTVSGVAVQQTAYIFVTVS